jgi:prepilin-type processing-associated H-X9-DG protein
VLLFEMRYQRSGSGSGANITDPTESDTAMGMGAPDAWCGGDLDSAYCQAVYATGPIGGYTNINNYNNTLGVHTNGSNWLACDGHVKWLNGAAVSAGLSALAPDNAEVHSLTADSEYAAGTGSMTQQNGSKVVLTFSYE